MWHIAARLFKQCKIGVARKSCYRLYLLYTFDAIVHQTINLWHHKSNSCKSTVASHLVFIVMHSNIENKILLILQPNFMTI